MRKNKKIKFEFGVSFGNVVQLFLEFLNVFIYKNYMITKIYFQK